MKLAELVKNNRSYRRFQESAAVRLAELEALVDLARLCASAANLQPLRYILCCEPGLNSAIFEHLSWAAYLKDWPGPKPGERPAAYVAMLAPIDCGKSAAWDLGIAAQTIMLGAVELGLGGCMLASIKDKPGLAAKIMAPQGYEILLVLALGKPREEVVLESLPPDGDVKYWRDELGLHHVPKRSLAEVVLRRFAPGPEENGAA